MENARWETSHCEMHQWEGINAEIHKWVVFVQHRLENELYVNSPMRGKEPINPKKTTVQTIEQVNMENKVKSIIFPTIIKLKTIELKVDAMLFENLVP